MITNKILVVLHEFSYTVWYEDMWSVFEESNGWFYYKDDVTEAIRRTIELARDGVQRFNGGLK